MLLIDSGVGIGSGWDGASQAGVAQLDALLAQLPLGLAMTDRDGRFLFANDAFLRSVAREGRGLPAFPTDLVVREDKAAISDAVRRFGRGPATSGDVAVRLVNSPEEPVSLGLAGVRGLGRGGGAAQPGRFQPRKSAAPSGGAGDQDAGGRPAGRRGRA